MEFNEYKDLFASAAQLSGYPFWISSALLFIKTVIWAYDRILDLRLKRIDVLKKEDDYDKEKHETI